MFAAELDLTQERRFYAERRAELLAEHAGRWVVVAGQTLLAITDSYSEALASGFRGVGSDAFLAVQVGGEPRPVVLPPRSLAL